MITIHENFKDTYEYDVIYYIYLLLLLHVSFIIDLNVIKNSVDAKLIKSLSHAHVDASLRFCVQPLCACREVLIHFVLV